MADMAAKNCPTLFVVPSWNPRMMYRLSSCELGFGTKGFDLRQCFWGAKSGAGSLARKKLFCRNSETLEICGVDDIG